MQKIDLPIEIEKQDLIKPTNPDFNWLFKMLLIIFVVVIFIYGTIHIFSYFVLKYLPPQKEKELFGNIISDIDTFDKFDYSKLSTNIDFGEKYNLFVSDSNEVNAFATIGSNIIINKGLIESIDYEEELLFIIGHEINHIENRDVLKGILKDIPFIFALNLLGFDIDFKIANLSDIAKSYSDKKIEMSADNAGAKIINDLGLNLECSLNFFKNEEEKFLKYLNFISTHPTNEARIKNLEAQIENADKECVRLDYIFD